MPPQNDSTYKSPLATVATIIILIVTQISPKRLCSRDMALFTCHDDPDRFFSTETHPAILDTTGNDTVGEALATANDYI